MLVSLFAPNAANEPPARAPKQQQMMKAVNKDAPTMQPTIIPANCELLTVLVEDEPALEEPPPAAIVPEEEEEERETMTFALEEMAVELLEMAAAVLDDEEGTETQANGLVNCIW